MRQLALCLLIGLSAVPSFAQAPREKTRAEWIALRDAKFALPEGRRAIDVLKEMNALLASTDWVLRDQVAYEAAAKWIGSSGLLSDADLRQVLAMWTSNLQVGLGTRDDDRVFQRSFSALNLSLLAARDNTAPFLTQEEFVRFLGDTLDYFERERDTRGYDAGKGWIHAAAHTADVLKFLARNPKLKPADQKRLLTALDGTCTNFGGVFQWGEDERIGQVVASLARRPDLDRVTFEAWLSTIPPRYKMLWANAPAVDPERFPKVENLKLVLRAAYVALSLDKDPAPGKEAAAAILATLRAMR